jgi:hypothetical protein
MSDAARARRVTAEIRWGQDAGAVIWVGQRTLAHYWPLLSPYFRDVFLPPHRKSEDDAVAWHWREAHDSRPPTTSELATLRKRLGANRQSFADNLARSGHGAETHRALHNAGSAELGAVLDSAVRQLVAKSDAELATFVCRTDAGLRFHSWAAPLAATPVYGDGDICDVSGVVLVAGKPEPGHDVVLEQRDGSAIAQMRSAERGVFSFRNVAPASYRLRVVSKRALFPPGGVEITVGRESLTGIELRSVDDSAVPTRRALPRATPSAKRLTLAALAIFVMGAAGWAWLHKRGRSDVQSRAATATESELRSAPPSRHAAKSDTRLAPTAAPSSSTQITVAAPPAMPVAQAASAETLSSDSEVERAVVAPSDPSKPALATTGPLPRTGAPIAAEAAAIAASAPPSPSAAGAQMANAKSTSTSGAPALAAAEPTTNSDSSTTRRSSRRVSAAPGLVGNEISETKPHREDDSLASDTAAPDEKISTDQNATRAEAEQHDEPLTARAPSRDARSDAPDGLPNDIAPEAPSGETHAHRASASDWHRTVHVQLSSWEPRLLGDAVLPTLPVPVGADDSVAALRDALLEQNRRALPASFREPGLSGGFIFLLPERDPSGAPEWEHASDARPAHARAGEREAEIGWREARPSIGERSLLRSRDGRLLAEIGVERNGAITLHLARGVEPTYWVSVAVAPADSAQHFVWRSGDGSARNATTRSAAGEARGYRLELPLTMRSGETVLRWLTLAAPDRGWGLTTQIQFRSESSSGR